MRLISHNSNGTGLRAHAQISATYPTEGDYPLTRQPASRSAGDVKLSGEGRERVDDHVCITEEFTELVKDRFFRRDSLTEHYVQLRQEFLVHGRRINQAEQQGPRIRSQPPLVDVL